jgi:phage shock protein E
MNWLDYILRRPAAEPAARPATEPLPEVPANDAMVVIDVRTEREFRQSALQGAANLPLDRLSEGIQALAPDPATPVVLYCATGARSGMGCQLLQQLGYRNVRNAGGVFQAAAQLGRSLV